MPTSGIITNTACSGKLYDDGGPSSDYSENTDGILVIQPPNSTKISLSFISFDFVGRFPGDMLYIYDGPSTSSPLIATLTANTFPGVINSTGGSITLRQKTDFWGTDPGFELNWSCTTGANVDVDEYNVFTDDFIIYPNPTTGLINIKSNNNDQLPIEEIILFNTVGQSVMKKSNLANQDQIQLDISHLPKGLYFINILSDKGLNTKKINLQ